jgi:hypothetical protein
MTTMYDWDAYYTAAALETNWEKIGQRINLAEFAIYERQRFLAQGQSGFTSEREALYTALNALGCLRSDVASWKARQTPQSVRFPVQRPPSAATYVR